MYANDLVLFSTDKLALQDLIDSLYDYCNKWRLCVNLLKTKILVCRGGGQLGFDDFWFWGDKLIDNCDSYKYLGIIFSSNVVTQTAVSNLEERADKALVSLRYRVKQIGSTPVNMYLKLFRHVDIYQFDMVIK